MTVVDSPPIPVAAVADASDRQIEQHVPWPSTANVDHANRVRANESGVKFGGHQTTLDVVD
jgi:pyruvate dehydrogenase E1 component